MEVQRYSKLKVPIILAIAITGILSILPSSAEAVLPRGVVDGFTACEALSPDIGPNEIYGWVVDDDNYNLNVEIHAYFDGFWPNCGAGCQGIGRIYGDESSVDLNNIGIPGNHRWSVPIPAAYRDGQEHSVYAFAISVPGVYVGFVNPRLSPFPLKFTVPATCAPPAKDPIGYQGATDCNEIKGWTCDEDNYDQALQVHFYKDGPAGTGTFMGATTASLTREPGVAAACGGNANHGFSFDTPEDFKDDTSHSIYAHAINIGTGKNVLLGTSPKSVTCAAPPSWGVTLSAAANGTLTATGSGTATGNVRWRFNCNAVDPSGNVDSTWDDEVNNIAMSAQTTVCAAFPPGTYTAKVRSTRGSLIAEATTQLTVPPLTPPLTTNVTITQPNYCSSGPAATVQWTYTGSTPQTAFRVLIDDSPTFGSPWVVDSGKVLSDGVLYQTGLGKLDYAKTYYAWVRVWDTQDQPSPTTKPPPPCRDTIVDWRLTRTWTVPRKIYGPNWYEDIQKWKCQCGYFERREYEPIRRCVEGQSDASKPSTQSAKRDPKPRYNNEPSISQCKADSVHCRNL